MLFSRRQRLLIVGCGDVGLRFLRQRQHLIQSGQLRVFVLTSSPKRIAELRALGAVPLLGNLDDSASLRRLRSLADRVLMMVPEPGQFIGEFVFNTPHSERSDAYIYQTTAELMQDPRVKEGFNLA